MNDAPTYHPGHASERIPEYTDPVCGMQVPADTAFSDTHNDTTYFFCSHRCIEKFKAAPDHYTGVTSAPDERTNEGAGPYTCPMHPEIVRNEPGSCPICGMALERREIAVEEENPELKDMTRRFWVSIALSLPVFVLAMTADLAPQFADRFIAFPALQWLEFALATPVVLWGGWPFFQRGWASIVNWHLNMFTLIALGIGVAWAFSTVAVIWPEAFPLSLRREDGTVPVYFEAAAVIWIFWLLVIVAIVAVVKAMMGGNTQRDARGKDSALSILEKRYACGEIDREEYQEKKRELEG